MKENVICGHLIPAGTGMRDLQNIVVGDKDDFIRAGLAENLAEEIIAQPELVK